MKVLAIVGMPGSGKSEALKAIEKRGVPIFNMGDVVTRIEPEKRGIKQIDEYKENEIRRDIRKKLGPAAIAIVIAEEIEKTKAEIIAIAGLHSFAELEHFRKKFNDLYIIALGVSKETRFKRLLKREYRALDKDAFEHREKRYSEDFDTAEIMEKAEYKIDNEGSLKELQKQVGEILDKIKGSVV